MTAFCEKESSVFTLLSAGDKIDHRDHDTRYRRAPARPRFVGKTLGIVAQSLAGWRQLLMAPFELAYRNRRFPLHFFVGRYLEEITSLQVGTTGSTLLKVSVGVKGATAAARCPAAPRQGLRTTGSSCMT
jgi:hypothetical protein